MPTLDKAYMMLDRLDYYENAISNGHVLDDKAREEWCFLKAFQWRCEKFLNETVALDVRYWEECLV